MATSQHILFATRHKALSLSWHHHHQYHHHFQGHILDVCSDAKHCLHLFTSLQELMKTSGGKNLHDVDYSIMEYPLLPPLAPPLSLSRNLSLSVVMFPSLSPVPFTRLPDFAVEGVAFLLYISEVLVQLSAQRLPIQTQRCSGFVQSNHEIISN
jgi:hypothetical protein